MRVFRCTCPDQPVLFFENVSCGSCGRLTGFSPQDLTLKPFKPTDKHVSDSPVWSDENGQLYLQCSNWIKHEACNWMVPLVAADPTASAKPENSKQPLQCPGCSLNLVIPDLDVIGNIWLWRKMETAKRRCMYTLLSLELPVDNAHATVNANVPKLAFKFLSAHSPTGHFETPIPDKDPVMTGHKNGVITINLAEADDVARTRIRLSMNEHYRTLLGHFRHETGHYYWEVFRLTIGNFTESFRALFGDETEDYADALDRHHTNGPIEDWQQNFVSSYAAAHPWEDWAETWAHYLHIIDTLQTRHEFAEHNLDEPTSFLQQKNAIGSQQDGLTLRLRDGSSATTGSNFSSIMSHWIDTSVMLNSLNRSMGLPDPYPFVLSVKVQNKLHFVDTAIRQYQELNPVV